MKVVMCDACDRPIRGAISKVKVTVQEEGGQPVRSLICPSCAEKVRRALRGDL